MSHLGCQHQSLVHLPECGDQSDTVTQQCYQGNVQTDVRIQNLALSYHSLDNFYFQCLDWQQISTYLIVARLKNLAAKILFEIFVIFLQFTRKI